MESAKKGECPHVDNLDTLHHINSCLKKDIAEWKAALKLGDLSDPFTSLLCFLYEPNELMIIYANKLPKSIIMCSLALTTTSAKRHGGELTSLQQIYLRQLKDLNELGGSLHDEALADPILRIWNTVAVGRSKTEDITMWIQDLLMTLMIDDDISKHLQIIESGLEEGDKVWMKENIIKKVQYGMSHTFTNIGQDIMPRAREDWSWALRNHHNDGISPSVSGDSMDGARGLVHLLALVPIEG
ncbi:hypothetical protein ACJX0J_039139 [Zea mays]